MLKHVELLSRMSAKQKIALVTNIRCLAKEEYTQLGFPFVKIVTLDELFEKDGEGLTPYVLARTWNLDLITSMTERVIARNCGDANVIILPSPKTSLGGEAQLALSEDPFLSTKIVDAFVNAVKNCNKKCILSGFYLTKKEVANMDVKPDQRALNDFLFAPFSTVAKKSAVVGVIGSMTQNEGAYEDFNRSLIRNKGSYFPLETFMACVSKSYEETVETLEEECILLYGVESAVQNAYDQYHSLMVAIKEGRASILHLEEAIAQKTVISDKSLDEAVERVLNFALRIHPYQVFRPAENLKNEPVVAENGETQTTVAESIKTQPVSTPSFKNASFEGESFISTSFGTEENHKPESFIGDSFISESIGTAEEHSQTSQFIQLAQPIQAEEVDAEQPKQEVEVVYEKTEEEEAFITRAIEKSTVLLKNNNVLPCEKKKTFAIIGDVAFTKYQDDTLTFAEHFSGCASGVCVGMERGYDYMEDRSDHLIAPAVTLANKASIAFVFLKPRQVKNGVCSLSSLPANQLALLHSLTKCSCKVVGILSTDVNIDVEFADALHGFVLAPIAGKLSATALANILFGRFSPSGKLTTTFYSEASKFFSKQRFYKDTGRNKVGIFLGYRLYDSQNLSMEYAFGFGLRYSKVEILPAVCNGGTLNFSVVNRGRFDVDEVIEVYVSMPLSKLLRPGKELKAFKTVHLAPGATQRVTISNIDFRIYDESTKMTIVENGSYKLYVGTAVNNATVTATTNVTGKTPSQKPINLQNYLQSKTNIISNNFTLEAKHNTMSNYKNFKNAGFICLLTAILVVAMSISASLPMIPLIIGGAFLVVALGLFIYSNKLKNRAIKEEARLIEQNKKLFQDEESVATSDLEKLFLKEFKYDVTQVTTKVEEFEEDEETNVELFNEDMSFAIAASDLKKFAETRGIFINSLCSASIISAFVSSRLIIAKTADENVFEPFMESIAGYFGARVFTEELNYDTQSSDDSFFYVGAGSNSDVSSGILSALISADENPQIMHVIYLKNLPAEKYSDYLIPYIKYFSNPHSKAQVAVKESDKLYTIPSNIWFITDLEKGSLVENLPSYILEHATVIPVQCTIAEPTGITNMFTPISMVDFEFLSERCKAKFRLNEDIWKKLDAIEAFVYKHTSYKIGNKFWLRIESYLSTLLSIESELSIAIDSMLASVVLPTLASVMVGKLDANETTILEEVERVFGEDNVHLSHAMLVSKA